MPSFKRLGLLLTLVVTLGCRGDAPKADPEQVSACSTMVEANGGTVLIGTEGTEELCQCIVIRVEEKIPDAADRWDALTEDLSTRIEKRGILGMAKDSAWMSNRGPQFKAFGEAYAGALKACTDTLLNATSTNNAR